MDPCDVEKLPYLKKEGLLHAAIMDSKTQEADQEADMVRERLKGLIRGMQRGRSH